jgi:hypothetical protein
MLAGLISFVAVGGIFKPLVTAAMEVYDKRAGKVEEARGSGRQQIPLF